MSSGGGGGEGFGSCSASGQETYLGKGLPGETGRLGGNCVPTIDFIFFFPTKYFGTLSHSLTA